MTIGEKIKKIREFRGMTQQELGEAVGFAVKNAAIRIAQYEMNYRVPKDDLIQQIAKALDVYYIAIHPHVSGAAEDIMQTLFWLEETNDGSLIDIFEILPAKKESHTYRADMIGADSHNPIGISINYPLVQKFMKDWMIIKQKLADGEINKGDYFNWKLNWPYSVKRKRSKKK
ncbi:MAG: helix-turn-helix domain-containing protein [Clostridiales Family XIII bacterium]|jgi:transcriptional regulator with XRE-family HTH domain|nr:helix-turn-helix domain-containing protein [Clostridiales Family XIII bacterium]